MYAGNIINFNPKFILPPPNINILPFLFGNNITYLNQLVPFSFFNSKTFFPKILVQKTDIASNENIQTNSSQDKFKNDLNIFLEKPKEQEKKAYFKVNYPPKDSLFAETDGGCVMNKEEAKLLQKKKCRIKEKEKIIMIIFVKR